MSSPGTPWVHLDTTVSNNIRTTAGEASVVGASPSLKKHTSPGPTEASAGDVV